MQERKKLNCNWQLKEPLLVCLLPIWLIFPIHFRLTQILCGALGLWPGECCLQGVHNGIYNNLQREPGTPSTTDRLSLNRNQRVLRLAAFLFSMWNKKKPQNRLWEGLSPFVASWANSMHLQSLTFLAAAAAAMQTCVKSIWCTQRRFTLPISHHLPCLSWRQQRASWQTQSWRRCSEQGTPAPPHCLQSQGLHTIAVRGEGFSSSQSEHPSFLTWSASRKHLRCSSASTDNCPEPLLYASKIK